MDNLMRINATVVSHTGTVSNIQQDNFYINGRLKNEYETDSIQVSVENSQEEYLFAVSDSLDRNEPEKRATVSMVRELSKLQETFRNNGGKIDGKLDRIKEQLQEINNLIYTLSINSTSVADTPASFAGILLSDGRACALNMGRSKVFILREGVFQAVFTDAKKTEKLLKLGILTDEQARMLSGQKSTSADTLSTQIQKSKTMELQAGDTLVLCTDGLSDYVDENKIKEALSSKKDTGFIANSLVMEAIKNGSRDNITVIVARLDTVGMVNKSGPIYTRDYSKKLDQQDQKRRKKENARTVAAVVVSSLAVVGVLFATYLMLTRDNKGDTGLVPVSTQAAEVTDNDNPAASTGGSNNTNAGDPANTVPDDRENRDNTDNTDRTPGQGTEYTVKAGDSLQKISLNHYGTVNKYKDIMKANNITDPDSIKEGQVLILP